MSNVDEFTHNLIRQFMHKMPTTYHLMRASDHNDESENIFSEWHIEGDVWTHTMMVVSHAVEYVRNHPHDLTHWKVLIIAALLHDLGKPMTREVKADRGKVTFYGHSGPSTFLAIDFLNKFEPALSHGEKIFVLELINYHQELFSLVANAKQTTQNKLLSKFNNAKGRRVLRYVNILRQLDYAGNIASRSDNVAHNTAESIIKQITGEYKSINDTKPTATIMVGLPGSGKSTMIKNELAGYPVVSRDDIVMEFADTGLDYSESFKTVDQKAVDVEFEKRFSEAIKNGKDFIIDRTNLSHKGRMKFINSLRPRFNVRIIVLLPCMSTVYARNSSRKGKIIPDNVFEIMMKSFDMPFPTEAEFVEYVFDH